MRSNIFRAQHDMTHLQAIGRTLRFLMRLGWPRATGRLLHKKKRSTAQLGMLSTLGALGRQQVRTEKAASCGDISRAQTQLLTSAHAIYGLSGLGRKHSEACWWHVRVLPADAMHVRMTVRTAWLL